MKCPMCEARINASNVKFSLDLRSEVKVEYFCPSCSCRVASSSEEFYRKLKEKGTRCYTKRPSR